MATVAMMGSPERYWSFESCNEVASWAWARLVMASTRAGRRKMGGIITAKVLLGFGPGVNLTRVESSRGIVFQGENRTQAVAMTGQWTSMSDTAMCCQEKTTHGLLNVGFELTSLPDNIIKESQFIIIQYSPHPPALRFGRVSVFKCASKQHPSNQFKHEN
jgi:hypothetical protein